VGSRGRVRQCGINVVRATRGLAAYLADLGLGHFVGILHAVARDIGIAAHGCQVEPFVRTL